MVHSQIFSSELQCAQKICLRSRSEEKFGAPLALNFSKALRSRSRSLRNEHRSIVHSFSKNFLHLKKIKYEFLLHFWLQSKISIKVEKSMRIKEIFGNDLMKYKFSKNCMILSAKICSRTNQILDTLSLALIPELLSAACARAQAK